MLVPLVARGDLGVLQILHGSVERPGAEEKLHVRDKWSSGLEQGLGRSDVCFCPAAFSSIQIFASTSTDLRV